MQDDLGPESCNHWAYALVLPPFVLALAITCFALPLRTTRPILNAISPFQPFLTLSEAAALLGEKPTLSRRIIQPTKPRLLQTVCLSGLALGETIAWFGVGSYEWVASNDNCNTAACFLNALAWLPGVVIPVLRPKSTPPYDLFAFYTVQFVIVLVHLGQLWYKRLPWVLVEITGNSMNLLACMVLLGIVFCMPLNVTSQGDIAEETTTSPEDFTSLWRWISFGWIYPLIEKGMYGTLNEADIWDLSPLMQSKALYEKLTTFPSRSLFRQLFAANSLDLILDITLTIISVFLNYASPFFLNRILLTLSTRTTDDTRTLITIYALLAFFSSLCKSEVDLLHLWHSRRASTRVRSELMALIYGKALVRKSFEGAVQTEVGGNAGSADVGKILNLMSGDANRLSMSLAAMHWVYGAPFEITIAAFFLYQLLGLSAFAGLLCVLLASPFNKALAKRTINVEINTLTARDKRLGLVTELLNGANFIKLSGWETHWINRVLTARNLELTWLTKSRINQVLFSAFWACVPIVVSVVSFSAFVMSGHELTIPVAFTAISLFNMVRIPLNGLPEWITQILRNGVSIKRIEAFLAEDEVPEQISSLKHARTSSVIIEEENCLGIKNGRFTWNSLANAGDSSSEDASLRRFELKDIHVVFPEGKLSVITGPTASGKTALLMALLGELTMLSNPDDMSSGQIFLPKHTQRSGHFSPGISYASQSPFLQNQTIRVNILFGEPYDHARYTSVLEATALIPDLQEFEKGDETSIGSRGVSLSGGQKARVALARAVYARSRYVLLDDVLSAVDSHTAMHLLHQLILGPLLADRTVVLVTHNVELVLPAAHYIVYMTDGRISYQGTAEDLHQRGILYKIIKETADGHSVTASDAKAVGDEGRGDKVTVKEDGSKSPPPTIQEEIRKEGSVKWDVYKMYLKSSSYLTWMALAAGISLYQFSGVGEKLWIKQWGEAYEQPLFNNISHHSHSENELNLVEREASSIYREASLLPSANQHPFFYVGVYAAITFGGAFISVINTSVEYAGGLRASRVLFTKLLVSVVHATIQWHNTTPTGRILNRFSKDIESVDTSLGSSIQAMTSSGATLVTSVLVVVVISPLFILPAAIIGCLYYIIVIRYLNVARDLRRMEANSRSPVFTDFSDLLTGIVTIRAFSAERRFLNTLHQKIDYTTKMSYFFWMASRWLSIRLDVLGAAGVFFTTFLAVSIGAGLAGVTITSALAFTTATYWVCRNWTQLELDLNSVERLIDYLELPQEPPHVIDNTKPPAYWPSNSSNDTMIDVQRLTMRHSPDLPTVLHDVSFTLKSKEKVGIVGRTGSGKSTLAMGLLRFAEPLSGTIRIDGIDISTIGLHDLRSRITFIAQDSILFSGTIRSNIDPFGDYTDAECLSALQRVHLLRVTNVEGDESGDDLVITLDTEVSAGGLNFSQGQRQLFSLARALLRQSPIIILDEATSSVDYETDVKIQATIREEFKNSLLITIAHRLRTVIDYDRLIVLEKGHIVEFDTPNNLIQKEGGVFRDMCIHSENFEELEKSAAEGHGCLY